MVMYTNHQVIDRARPVSPAVAATMPGTWRGLAVASTTGSLGGVCPTHTTGTKATGAFVNTTDRHPRHLGPRPT